MLALVSGARAGHCIRAARQRDSEEGAALDDWERRLEVEGWRLLRALVQGLPEEDGESEPLKRLRWELERLGARLDALVMDGRRCAPAASLVDALARPGRAPRPGFRMDLLQSKRSDIEEL